MSTTPSDLEQTPAAWDAIAAGYDQYVTDHNMRLAEQTLDLAGVRAGTRFLDVAAGTGALSIPAARRGAEVLAVDIAPAMLERLAARARVEGLHRIHTRVADGHALDLPDAGVDVAGSQFGVSLFPDLAGGLAELVRVTRPGGTVAVVAFGPLAEMEFLPFFVGAMRAVVPGFAGPPMDPPPLPFRLGDPDLFRRVLTTAGLTGVEIVGTVVELRFRSGRHMWDWFVSSNPIGAGLVAGLTAEEGERVRAVLDERLVGHVLHNRAHIAVGGTGRR
jgi:ubiquinone/menaquinone biosynthesis C-methylase UbiE